MQFKLKPLDYPTNALEPQIDARTVEIHHDKHQAAYVANLNAALESSPEFGTHTDLLSLIKNLRAVPEKIREAVRNNVGGVWNHEFYWDGLTPKKTEPSAEFKAAVEKSFGSFEKFKEKLLGECMKRFGSGWGWVLVNPDGTLKVVSTPNQDNPLMGEFIGACGCEPVLTIDVWEHAYYLKYQNKRAEYLENIWDKINWEKVSERYAEAVGM